jgi:hypothetical protein
MAMIRSAPRCLAASTASRPTAPPPTTVAVLPGGGLGGNEEDVVSPPAKMPGPFTNLRDEDLAPSDRELKTSIENAFQKLEDLFEELRKPDL